MAQHTYFLAENATDPLTLSWGFNWKNLKVIYQDELVGEIGTKKALIEGQEFQLPDNRKINVKLKGSFMPQLEVLADGAPVNGSATDPEAIISQIYKLSLVLGVLNFGLGLIAVFWPADFLLRLGMGVESMISGVIITGLAYGIKKRSMAALIGSIAFWVLDYGLSIYFAAQETGSANPSSGLIMRLVIVYSLYRGIGALKQLKRSQQPALEVA